LQTCQIGLAVGNKLLNYLGLGRLSDLFGHVECEEIARLDESIHIFQMNMVRIDIIPALPIHKLHGMVGFPPGIDGMGTDNAVLPEGFIPDRHDLDSSLPGLDDSLKLSFALSAKTVPHPKRILLDVHIFTSSSVRIVIKTFCMKGIVENT